MKTLLALCAAAVLAAGCATDGNTQYAKADCKVVPVTTASVAGGKTRPVSSLEQRQAEMALATSEYRRTQLAQNGRFGNNVEDALYDCASR
jgi:hypothetical protein